MVNVFPLYKYFYNYGNKREEVLRKFTTSASLAWDVCSKPVTLPCAVTFRNNDIHPTANCKMISGFQTLKEILYILFLKPNQYCSIHHCFQYNCLKSMCRHWARITRKWHLSSWNITFSAHLCLALCFSLLVKQKYSPSSVLRVLTEESSHEMRRWNLGTSFRKLLWTDAYAMQRVLSPETTRRFP